MFDVAGVQPLFNITKQGWQNYHFKLRNFHHPLALHLPILSAPFLRPSCDGAATPFWLQDPFQFKTTQGQLREQCGTIRSLPRHEIHQPLAVAGWISHGGTFFFFFQLKFWKLFVLSRWIHSGGLTCPDRVLRWHTNMSCKKLAIPQENAWTCFF